MIGPPRRQMNRFQQPPETGRYLRWVARAPGQVLACLTHRHARPARGGADIADRREQAVLPEVIGPATRRPHPADPVRSPPWRAAAASNRVLELLILPAAERCTRAGNCSRSPLQGQRAGPAGPAPVQARPPPGAGTPRRGRCCSRGCSGASSLTSSKMSASRAQPVEQGLAGGHSVPPGSAAFLAGQYPDSRARTTGPPGGPCRPMPAADRCQRSDAARTSRCVVAL